VTLDVKTKNDVIEKNLGYRQALYRQELRQNGAAGISQSTGETYLEAIDLAIKNSTAEQIDRLQALRAELLR
jgi:hypothetical protein